MASTKFGTYYLDNDCSNMHRNNYNMNSENFETESFKLLFILMTSFFAYNFSTKLFENNKNIIKPLECSYKFLFNYVNNQDLSEEVEVSEEEVSEEVEAIEEDKYNELIKEHEFKVVLLNFLKNKDSSNDEKFEKYKSLIENLEKDIQEYVYV